MTRSMRIFLSLVIFLSTAFACNLQTGVQPTLSVNDQAATIIAATLQAENGGDVPITATFSPVPQATSTVVAASTRGPTATITPTYSVPMLTLREPTNCRTGPGLSYDILFPYVKGVKREIIGSYPQENYWLIKAPESSTGECWIWGEYAELSGSYWAVPTLTPPPTATLAPPVAPAITKWDFFCNTTSGEMNITILWRDNTNNESGFVVYRDGERLAELPPDSTSYAETIVVDAGEEIQYQVEVSSPGGKALSAVVSVTC